MHPRFHPSAGGDDRRPAAPSGGGRRRILAAAVALAAALAAPVTADAACGGGNGRLRVLTFNLEFTRAFRAEHQVGPLARRLAADPPDLVLLQEVAGGLVIGAESVAHLLAGRLREAGGPTYEVVYAPAAGVAGFYAVGNAVLSRCPVLARRTIPLPGIAELTVAGGRWRLGRNLLRVDVRTAAGVLHVFDTHLCADCGPSDRARQLRAVLAAVRRVAAGGAPVILAGDFNVDVIRDDGAERFLYDAVLRAGFRDTVGDGRGWCARPGEPDRFCTVGVAEPFRRYSRRIDYIFVRGLDVAAHTVLFNPRLDPTAPAFSDHAAVAATLVLPARREAPSRTAAASPG